MKKIGSLFSLFLFLALGLSAQPTWLDSGFGRQGVFVQDSMYINTLLVQHDGKILAGGGGGVDICFAVMRLNQDGSIDSSFGKKGYSFANHNTIPPGYYWSEVLSLAQQADDKIIASGVVGGVDATMEFYVSGMFIVRYNSNGVIDSSFAKNGIDTVVFDHKVGYNFTSKVSIGNSGRIYLY